MREVPLAGVGRAGGSSGGGRERPHLFFPGLGTNKPVEARFRPWLEQFSVRKFSRPFKLLVVIRQHLKWSRQVLVVLEDRVSAVESASTSFSRKISAWSRPPSLPSEEGTQYKVVS